MNSMDINKIKDGIEGARNVLISLNKLVGIDRDNNQNNVQKEIYDLAFPIIAFLASLSLPAPLIMAAVLGLTFCESAAIEPKSLAVNLIRAVFAHYIAPLELIIHCTHYAITPREISWREKFTHILASATS